MKPFMRRLCTGNVTNPEWTSHSLRKQGYLHSSKRLFVQDGSGPS